MKNSRKLKKTNLESKKNEELQKFSAKRMLEEDEGKEEEKNREGRRRVQNFFPSPLFLLVYIKRKREVKDDY